MNKKEYKTNYLFATTLRLLSVIFLFIVTRWFFYLLNTNLFSATFRDIVKTLFIGIRFDISAIFYLNSLYIIMYVVPFRFREKKTYQKVAKYLFISINSIAILANCADIVYYRFTLKRTTADIFSYFTVGGDFDKLLPQFLKDFWYIALIWLAMVTFMIWFYSKISFKSKNEKSQKKYYLKHLIIFICSVFIVLMGMRGGIQLRPINIISASVNSNANLSPIVLNTPFTILQTIGKQELKPIKYFGETEVDNIYSPIHNSLINNKIPDSITNKKNIVVIIVESLSSEHIGAFNKNISNYKGFTPFLDSIIGKSMVFKAIANGKKSIEGIPAILSGIPTLMSNPFIGSPYSGNKYESLPSKLKKYNYTAKFFHGGTNGTMGFDSYCKIAGFDSYFGKSEYNNDADYDGKWGIWDEPFLNYFSENLNSIKQPFFASIFTLSSHHPYKVPDKYKEKFAKGKLPIQETIGYTDFCLQKFFEKSSNTNWFKNTLFIITADHTSEASLPEYSSNYGIYRIPIIFYDPTTDLSIYSDNLPAQQIDIMPTVLSYLGLKDKIFCFGNNLLDTNSLRFAINYQQPFYQLIMLNYLLQFDGQKSFSIFDIYKDPELKNNLLKQKNEKVLKLEKILKAFIQQYNNRLIYNKMM